MTESRRKPREADSRARRGEDPSAGGAPEEQREPRPLNSAGRPVAGPGRAAEGAAAKSTRPGRRGAGAERGFARPGHGTAGPWRPGDPPLSDPAGAEEGAGGDTPGGGWERGWNPFDDEPPGGAGAAADWERLRGGGPWSGAGRAGGAPPPPGGPPSLGSLLVLLEALRGMVPHELERQFSALLREVLLTLRALIDWYLERLDGDEPEQRVEDIPID